MPMVTKRKNPNALQQIAKEQRELERIVVRVGWATDMGASPEDVSIVAINAFGAPSKNIPARPVLPGFMASQRGEIRSASKAAVRAAQRGKSAMPVMQELSRKLADGLKEAVYAYDEKPNAPSTAAQKGFNDPLVGAGSEGGRIVATANSVVIKR
jgi:hypothetical protein